MTIIKTVAIVKQKLKCGFRLCSWATIAQSEIIHNYTIVTLFKFSSMCFILSQLALLSQNVSWFCEHYETCLYWNVGISFCLNNTKAVV